MSILITKKKDADSLPFPPPVYVSGEIAEAEKDGTRFTVVLGLDKALVRELKDRSLDESDEAIQALTSDRKRFGEGSYEEWYAKDRVPFALVSEKDKKLAALIWFGPKKLGEKSLKHAPPETDAHSEESGGVDWHTLAYCSYPPFRGTGIMKDFVNFTIGVYLSHHIGARLWAIIDRHNPASMRLAEKLNFTALDERSDESHVVMVRS